ncbi:MULTISPECIES: hemolysin family protein [Clostridium]|uniref:HlyC/CorC family transporter n=1 Tax=Clostridium cibarium TaxID=2762247 RepID=A0ABR8PY45_9CLOT|nr:MULTISPECIES: hemolysin family protein [Clostridium]MBD7913044.1 HlyC/CorC family transporter [Clostridium cibarium]
MDEGPGPNASNISYILLLVALTLINAFFAAAEMAIVSVNKNKLKMLANEGNKKAKVVCKLIEEPTKFLSTIQVGITLAGFFASASAATGVSKKLGELLISLNISYGEEIAFIGVTIILSYFTLVFGELFPKRLALNNSENIAMSFVGPIMLISKVLSPFIKILAVSTNFLVKITGLNKDYLNEKVTKEEIKSILEEGQVSGTINENEKEMIDGILEFDDKRAEKVMTPRTEVYCIDIEDTLDDYIDELLEKRYTRIPVYEGNIDNIIGILYMKDFLIEAKKKGFENVDLRDILIEPSFVPECKRVKDLFKEMKASKSKLAIIIDEYGGFSGIVTIEDLVEEIMGEINDEYDIEEEDIVQIGENSFLAQGTMPLEDLEEKLDIDFKTEDIDTLSGFLINTIGKIPSEENEKVIEYDGVIFKVHEVNEKRIEKVIIQLNVDNIRNDNELIINN